jgi:RHS repeat-associated protein
VAQGSLTVGLGYDNANRRTSLSYPNGTSTSYTYDVASRLTNINHVGPSGIIEALTYQYDTAGNRSSLTRTNGAASILPNAVVSATYDAANEQTVFAGTTLTYDNNGNLTNDGTNTFVWDSRNRLGSMSGGSTASFNYDALGRRTSKLVNSVTSQYLYDGNDIASEIGGGAIGANYLRSLNIDEPFVRQTGTRIEHYHTDALGSSLALSDASGGSATTYTYEPFGKTTISGASSNPFQYTGRENDGTALYHYRTRPYYPQCQRFTREDPIGLSGGLNYYSYTNNAPVNYNDPTGLYGPGGAAAGAAISAIGQAILNAQQGANIGRSLRCVNMTNVALSAAMGALGPTFTQQFVRGTPGPWLSGFPLPPWGERIIYAEVWAPLGGGVKKAAPDITIGDILRGLPSAIAEPLGARKDDDCSALTLRNSIGAFFQ